LPVLPQGALTRREPLCAQRFIIARTLPSVWRTTISGRPAISLLIQSPDFGNWLSWPT
jgi:hypothetical protein